MKKSKVLMAIIEAVYHFQGTTVADRKAGFASLKTAFDLESSRLTKRAVDGAKRGSKSKADAHKSPRN